MAARTSTHVALLRGINVGGKNKLPMGILTELFTDAGCRDVRTYIQSGNVVFQASPRVVASLAEELNEGIHERLGLSVPLVLRSAREFASVLTRNPFVRAGAKPDALHVAFLAERPERSRAALLDPTRSPGDAFELLGRELYLHLPNGVARTRLTNAWLDKTLGTTSTVRNWRTVTTLGEMTRGPGSR